MSLPPGGDEKGGWIKALRDGLIFSAGLAGFAHEVVLGTSERPFLLIMCAAMMGLPALVRLDEWRRGNGK